VLPSFLSGSISALSRGCDRLSMYNRVAPLRRWKSSVLAASAMPRQVALPVPVGLAPVGSPAAQAWAVWKGPRSRSAHHR